MDLAAKLAILADAAKYDASCASSGTNERTSRGSSGVGSTTGMGICHSYTPDGRCVSLLKILLTNYCVYDCLYCINRVSSDTPRAQFTVDEVVRLTLDFYRRNFIEGLFLSSGVVRSPDYTMERVVEVARRLRRDHDFRGYIHLKTIPEASPALIAEAGRLADRISINVELPTDGDLAELAPEKDALRIRAAMADIRGHIDTATDARRTSTKAPSFAPAGQSTQMIIGATPATDRTVIAEAASLYRAHRLRRVYYSAYSPIPDAPQTLPAIAPPLVREHRLYQADWLMRFYGFAPAELTTPERPNLDLHVDPKLAWAIRHPEQFPVDVNRAAKEQLLRVPGLGVRTVQRILQSRRARSLRLDDLRRLRVPLRTVRHFVVTADHTPHRAGLDRPAALARLARPERQLSLFGDGSAVSGEL
jgi:putative DNA modification/repair radical SAM protein